MNLEIQQPTLLLDKVRCIANIKTMKAKADRNKVIFRPHFKTHQSHKVGRWFRNEGVTKCAVSTLDMAIYFADDGWDDITLAFPVNILEIDKINNLAGRINLNIIVEDPETLMRVDAILDFEINGFIKIDVGYGRTGIPADRLDQIDELIKSFNQVDLINLKGFLGHAGHSYKARSKSEILEIHESSKLAFRSLNQFKSNHPNLLISAGDTPTCSVAEDFTWCDEMRPGNFVFYDLAQWQIGSNELDQIAVAMACPVVAKHPDRNQIVVYGGGSHFGKDRITLKNNKTAWGLLVNYNLKEDHTWSILENQNWVVSLSQEHGIIEVDREIMDRTMIGEILTILPVHSCMAGLAMGEYLTTDNKIISRL